MKKVTIAELKRCAQDLKRVRVQLSDNLEPRVTELLDSVINRFEQCETVVTDRAAMVALIDDGIQIAGHLGEAILVAAHIFYNFRQ
jgi:hypothetical protein